MKPLDRSGRRRGLLVRDVLEILSSRLFRIDAWGGNRTRTSGEGLRILSPVRLPVPPPRRRVESTAQKTSMFCDDFEDSALEGESS